jgi:hypothetical protein
MGIDGLDKEATLREVLSEISLAQLFAVLKFLFLSTGFLYQAILIAISLLISHFITPAISGANVYSRAFIVCVFVWIISSVVFRSYHSFRFEFYFPKLNWLGAFFLSAYLLGFWELTLWKPEFIALGFIAIWLWVYAMVIFLVVINIGHIRLMERRKGRPPSEDISFHLS